MNTAATMALTPIAMATAPTAPCRLRLAHVSQRAEIAIGTAITVDRADAEQRHMTERPQESPHTSSTPVTRHITRV